MLWLWNKIKDFIDLCIKYWQATLAFFLMLLGYIIGRSRLNKDTDVELSDANLQNDNLINQIEGAAKIYEENRNNIKKNFQQKIKRIEEIKQKKDQTIKDLENNVEKLDKILQDKHGLKKG